MTWDPNIINSNFLGHFLSSFQRYLDSGLRRILVKIQVRLVWLLTILRSLASASNFDGSDYIDICIKVSLLIPT